MKITIDDFNAVCPAARTPGDEIFQSIAVQISKWDDWARALSTPEVYERLDSLDTETVAEDYDTLTALRRYLVGLVCSMAFWDAIPQLDLVLTATGFGVVSNSNVAPASAERVAALRTQIRRQALVNLEAALEDLRSLGVPAKSKLCARFFRSLFWRSSHMRRLGVIDPTLDDLQQHMPALLQAQQSLAGYISSEQMEALLRAQASAETDAEVCVAIDKCRDYIAYHASDRLHLCETYALEILGYMERNLDKFPEYRDSQTYKANHFERYENKADDPCFFFI